MSTEQDQSLFEAQELFFFAFRAFTARPDEILAARGFARVHHRILYFVARRPGQRVSELLATLGVSKQALHAPLRQLVEAGLVNVAADAEDKRGRCLSLTDAGVKLEAELSQTQRELMAEVFRAGGVDAEAGWRAIMSTLAAPIRPQLRP